MTKKELKLLDKYYSKYGITYAQYLSKLKEQNFKCELCGKHRNNFTRRMHQDHDHRTGKSRGIICYYCNRRRVGQLTLEWAEKVYKYLKKYCDHESSKLQYNYNGHEFTSCIKCGAVLNG